MQYNIHEKTGFLFFNILLFMLLQLSHFSPSQPPSQLATHFNSQSHTVVHVYGSFMYVLWPVTSPSFSQSPSVLSAVTAVSLYHDSVPLVLFFSLGHKWDIWYLSFIDWLISLSTIVSSSIHFVIIGRNSFFFFSCYIVLHWWALRLFPNLGYCK